MALTALPRDWMLKEGTLGTDIDEDTSIFLTGSRSLKFVGNGNTITLMSKPFGITDGEGVPLSQQRRAIGLTGWGYVKGTITFGDYVYGVSWYDSAGVFLSSSTLDAPYSTFPANKWFPFGKIFSAPLNARYCRVLLRYSHASVDALVDSVSPYFVPPSGHATKSAAGVSTTVGTAVPVGLNLVSPAVNYPSHGCSDDTATIPALTGRIRVSEAGLYQFTAAVWLDQYDASDVLQLGIRDTTRTIWGQRFSPSVASSGLTFGAYDPPALAMHGQLPSFARVQYELIIGHWAGTSRTVTEAEFRLAKDN